MNRAAAGQLIGLLLAMAAVSDRASAERKQANQHEHGSGVTAAIPDSARG